MIDIRKKILQFHEDYNLIFDEQNKLPQKKGKKDYSNIEFNIFSMAQNLIEELEIFKKNILNKDDSYFDQIDNIIDGCFKLIKNPYDRFGGRIHIDK